MTAQRDTWQAWFALFFLGLAVALPLGANGQVYLIGATADSGRLLFVGVSFLVAFAAVRPAAPSVASLFLAFVAHAGAALALFVLPDVDGAAGPGFWALIVANWLLAWSLVVHLSSARPAQPFGAWLGRMVVPAIFGIWVLILWEVLVRGFAVPTVILPPPSAIWERIADSQPILWADFQQTFMRAVLAGYAIGCLAGFLVALLADRSPFLRKGLLPIGNLVSALPIIGIAPIMVMWFGFDWQSKAAVVAVMTFFPMMVNTVAGLNAAEPVHRDLMRTYAADGRQEVALLKLPAAMPFIFNALKINTTLALVGAIVAEFFGTPIVGMGFRISTEIGRLGVDMVWAEIAVAALAGSAFYGVMALFERVVTFWHPSVRQGRT